MTPLLPGARPITCSIRVAAPAGAVFDLLRDPYRHPEIDGSGTLRATVRGPHRLEAGSRFGVAMRYWWLPYMITNTVTEYEPDRLIAWTHMSKVAWRYQLEPVAGGTQLTETWDPTSSPTVLEHSGQMIGQALSDGAELTRKQLGEAVARLGVDRAGPRFALMLMHAELSGVICSGVPSGRQQTYALVDRRVPKSRELTGDDALAELTHRYFTSHGPASLKDFAWWSSLTRAEILRGLELTGDLLRRDELGGVELWGPPDDEAIAGPAAPTAHLVQAYDEYIVGYTQTRYVLDLIGSTKDRQGGTVGDHLLIDGQVTGRWRRTVTRESVTIEVTLDRPLSAAEDRRLRDEAAALGRFLGLEATLRLT